MKVLHAYSHDNPRLAMYVSLLSQAMPADVECVCVDNASDMRRAVGDFRPDIVHQHGCFPMALAAEDHGDSGPGREAPPPRLVVSPHGENAGTESAYAVIARSPYELDACKAQRKELVQNPLITRTITFREAAGTMAGIYRRVMDSNPLEMMGAPTRHFLALALKAGLLGSKEWVADDTQRNADGSPAADNRPPTPDTALLDLRHLCIYAGLEGVAAIVQHGMDILGAAATGDCPCWRAAAEARPYLPQGYSVPTALPGASVTEMLRDIEQNGITLLRLTELTSALYNDNLDEKALMEQAEAEKLRPMLQSVLQVLSEQTLLTEGFMPCPPIDNTDTQWLRQQLENHLKLLAQPS